MKALAQGSDGRDRCAWGVSTPDYVVYHDQEWGRPISDDRGIYERLCLEADISFAPVARPTAAVPSGPMASAPRSSPRSAFTTWSC